MLKTVLNEFYIGFCLNPVYGLLRASKEHIMAKFIELLICFATCLKTAGNV